MKLLGTAKLVESTHVTGARVKSWDLTPFGGPLVFMGRVESPLPAGTTDRGNLRLELNTGKVWQLEGGEPGPTAGPPGTAGAPVRMMPLLLIAFAAYFFGLTGLRRRR